jgi:4a-hydroxytetrahydrobiopterin dehydratase
MSEGNTMTTSDLLSAHCSNQTEALTPAAAQQLLPLVPGWAIDDGKLCRDFGFANYYQTLAFVNALAFITHEQDHHPELTVTYKNCVVRYDTHSVNDGNGGLSQNDFICAAKASALTAGTAAGAEQAGA